MFAPGLYAIADADHTPDVEAWGNTLLASGAKTLQLRAKSWSKSEITRVARALVTSAHRYGAVFILNDHPDIAATVHAHGVHLGQTDMSPDEARAIVGPDVLIGLSTHTIDQVEKTRVAEPQPTILALVRFLAPHRRQKLAFRGVLRCSQKPYTPQTYRLLPSVGSTPADCKRLLPRDHSDGR